MFAARRQSCVYSRACALATGLNTDDPMKTYIYYPGMEVRDELWLKFALIYLERLAFVFTVSEKSGLTALLDTLRQQSDLLAERPAAVAISPRARRRGSPRLASSVGGAAATSRRSRFGSATRPTTWRTPAP